MLDPFTITSLSIKVASSAGQLFFELKALRARYKAVPRNLQLFSSQVAALRTAVTGVSTWLEQSVERDENAGYVAQQQFEEDLKDVLEGCNILITLLADHIKGFTGTGEPISATSRAKFMWSEEDLDEHRKVLGYQCDALMLILKSFELTSKKTPAKPLQDVAKIRHAIAQAKDAACSIISNDTSSNRTEKQGPEFGAPIPQGKSRNDMFDAELNKSGPYSWSKRSMGSSTTAADSSTPMSPSSDASDIPESDALARCHRAEVRAEQLQEVVGAQQLAIAKLKQEKEGLKIVQTYISDYTVLQAQLEERENSLRLATEKLEQARKAQDDDQQNFERILHQTKEDLTDRHKKLVSQLHEQALAAHAAKQETKIALQNLREEIEARNNLIRQQQDRIAQQTSELHELRLKHNLERQRVESLAGLVSARESLYSDLIAKNDEEAVRAIEQMLAAVTTAHTLVLQGQKQRAQTISVERQNLHNRMSSIVGATNTRQYEAVVASAEPENRSQQEIVNSNQVQPGPQQHPGTEAPITTSSVKAEDKTARPGTTMRGYRSGLFFRLPPEAGDKISDRRASGVGIGNLGDPVLPKNTSGYHFRRAGAPPLSSSPALPPSASNANGVHPKAAT